MSRNSSLHVIIRLPLSTLHDGEAMRLTAVSSAGSFGLLPNHVDTVSDLQPSLVSLWNQHDEEQLFGIDEGLLVKQGKRVLIAVRRGLKGDSLERLQSQVTEQFRQVDDQEKQARAALSRLEANMARSFIRLQRDY